MKFENEKNAMLELLQESAVAGNVIGIEAKDALGTGVFVTAVENIATDNEEVIVTLKPYDNTGYMLKKHKLSLSEIDAVCRFASPSENPYYKELTGIRFHRIN